MLYYLLDEAKIAVAVQKLNSTEWHQINIAKLNGTNA
jgi:hypothetical protein